MQTTLYYQEEDNSDAKYLREYNRAEDGQAVYLADQMLADIFGLGSGVSPVGYFSF